MFRGAWRERLAFVVEMMRDLRAQTDPYGMVQSYSERMDRILPADGYASLSRRTLMRPQVRVTRSHIWPDDLNPWTARQRTILDAGILSDLIWGEEPTIIN